MKLDLLSSVVVIKDNYDLQSTTFSNTIQHKLKSYDKLLKSYTYKKLRPINYRKLVLFCDLVKTFLKATNQDLDLTYDLENKILDKKFLINGLKDPSLKVEYLLNKILIFIELNYYQGNIINISPIVLTITVENNANYYK